MRAVVLVPSAYSPLPVVPVSVVTAAVVRSTWRSTPNSWRSVSVLPLTTMWKGRSMPAAVPMPSAVVAVPLPASVSMTPATLPLRRMRWMRWLPESPTKTSPFAATATPAGLLNPLAYSVTTPAVVTLRIVLFACSAT